MKPETSHQLTIASLDLQKARTILAAGVPDVAARECYMAKFHAAQGLIFERVGRTPKTHHGVHSAFHMIAKHELALDPGMGARLTSAYAFKEIADYTNQRPITEDEAAAAIEDAAHFLATIEALLADPPVR